MIRTTRGLIVIFLVIYVITITIGFIQINKSDREKIDLMISELKSEKGMLLGKTIEFKSKNLITYSYDYTYWDEMVAFVQKGDPQWAFENIDASVSTYEVDYVWIYRPDLSLVYSYSPEKNEVIKMLPFDNFTLGQIIKTGKTPHFFINYNSNIIEISGASVHPSSDLGRVTIPQGYFFAGRLWNERYLAEIGLFTESKINIHLPDYDENFKTDFSLTKFDIRNDYILSGWNTKPVANISSIYNFEVGKSIELRAQKRFVYGSALYFFFIFGFIAFMLLRVFHPLGQISKSLKYSNSIFLYKLFKRGDEFGKLSNLINNFFKQKDQLIAEIAERREIENLLRKLSQAIEQSPATIIITSTEGKIEYVNPKFTQLTGYKLDEVIGENPHFLKTGSKSSDDFLVMWDTIKSGKVWKGEFSSRKKSGEIYYESAIVSPIFDDSGNIINFLAVNEDITHDKRDDQIREVIFKIAQAGSVSKDLGDLISKIHIYLKELIDVTNYYLALYDEKNDSFFLPHFEDQKDSISTFKAKKTLTAYLLKSKRSMLLKETEIDKLKKEGIVESIGESAKVWLGVPLSIDDKIIGVFVVQSYDDENAFTEDDREMLEFISHEMSHTIQRMKADDELKAALEKAELSDKLKSSFLANISHEIRTPLNSILGFTRLMNDDVISSEKKKQFSKMIKSNGDQLLSIINDLLDFSLLETGQFKLVKKEFDVEKLIHDLRKEYHHYANERGIELRVSHGESKNGAIIESDLSRVRQIIRNLINNALKFTKSGFIELGYALGEEGVTIYVKDTGIGIPDDFRDQIFRSFTQAEKSRSRKFSGNGLGLALSKKIIEKLGGKIWFESEENKGSIFYIFLPD